MPHKAKNTYPTRSAAVAVAARRALKTGIPLRVYPCGECHGFHITSEVRRGLRKAPGSA